MKVKKSFRLAQFTIKEIKEIQEAFPEYEWSETAIVEMAVANMHRVLVRGED